MLAYYVLWREARPEGWTADELARRAEALMFEGYELRFRFEAQDALRKLEALGMLRSVDAAHHASQAPKQSWEALRQGRVFHLQPSLWDAPLAG